MVLVLSFSADDSNLDLGDIISNLLQKLTVVCWRRHLCPLLVRSVPEVVPITGLKQVLISDRLLQQHLNVRKSSASTEHRLDLVSAEDACSPTRRYG